MPAVRSAGTVPTAYLDDVLQRNERTVISCTKYMCAACASRRQIARQRPINDEVGGIQQMAKEEADDKHNNDDAFANDGALFELGAQYIGMSRPFGHAEPPDAGTNSAKGPLPLWLRPQSEKKD